MRRQRLHKITAYGCLLLMVVLLFGACGKEQTTDSGVNYFHHSIADERNTQETERGAEETSQKETFLLTAVDQIQESLQVYRYADGMEYRYYYGTGTRFYDKYGNRTTVTGLKQGMLVTIGDVDNEGILTEAGVSDAAWVYDDVVRFSVNPDLDMLKIGDQKYRYTDETICFSGDDRIAMTDLQDGDTLRVVGQDKQILSVCVTTAQGTLSLEHTDLFEGSFLQLGTKIFAEITPDMELSVPEGTYELRVANKGWGGSQEVTITRGKTTEVDLDKIKGSGPSYGKIQFVIDVDNATLWVDGKETGYKKPVKLTYGQHSLVVYADGYDAWKRNLYVNSKESTIAISLKDEDTQTAESSTGSSQSSTQSSTGSSQSSAQSSTGSSQSSSQSSSGSTASSQNSSQTVSSQRQEELDTLKDLISSLTSSSSIVSN